MLIAVVNDSKLVKDSEIETMVKALQIQLDSHFLPAWNIKQATISFFQDKSKVPEHAWIMNMLDNSTQAGALGYHSIDDGVSDAFVFAEPVLSNGGVVYEFDPKNPTRYTVSSTVSHELLELIGDPMANSFALGPDTDAGNLYCIEMCDAVEGDSYGIEVDGAHVAVSNFLLPSWFNPQATTKDAPFDYLSKLKSSFSMDEGGYMIMASMTNEQQVTAKAICGEKLPEWRKDHANSAYYRR